jgi:ribulose-phosphate 3-epimerase
MTTPLKIAPSILSADFSNLAREITDIDKAGADYIHMDIMDGSFVDTITIGPAVIKALRPHSQKTFDTHLMINNPAKHIQAFADAGSDIITIHQEAVDDLLKIISQIKSLGKKAGVSIKPETNPEVLNGIFEEVDLILVMTVNPGFGGQKFLDSQLSKIAKIRENINNSGRKIDLEVDGGINKNTAHSAKKAGANVLVAGSAIFTGNPRQYQENITQIRNS